MSNNNKNKQEENDDDKSSSAFRIVIVGAGMASIQLAHTLWNEVKQQQSTSSTATTKKSIDITILEANDYIGGRVCSFEFQGHMVEKGANWISGRDTAFQNPIWKMALEIELQGHVSDRENQQRVHAIHVNNNNNNDNEVKVITKEYLQQVDRFENIYAKALEEMATVTNNQNQNSKDKSVRFLLEKHGWPPQDQLTDMECAVEHNLLEVWVADQLDNLSSFHDMKSGANDMDLGQDEMFVEDSRGFNSIFQNLVNDLIGNNNNSDNNSKEEEAAQATTTTTTTTTCTTNILLGRQVESIHYEPGTVKVVAKNVNRRDDSKEEQEVYSADIVISTVSLGVLQSDAIQFVPPLPDWKRTALNQVGMFTFAKVFCNFSNSNLWPSNDKDYLVFVDSERRGHYPLWMRYKHQNVIVKDDSTNNNNSEDGLLLMCYLGGSQAERVESLSEEQVKDEIEELFRQAFVVGNNAATSEPFDCRPVSVKVTDWSRNPRFCGSYSYFPVGALETVPEEDYRKGLTGIAAHDVSSSSSSSIDANTIEQQEVKPPPTLYFAGEAFDDKFNGWVQGGYLSGERTARQILKDYLQNK